MTSKSLGQDNVAFTDTEGVVLQAKTDLPPQYNEELATNVAGEELQTHLAENQEFDKNAAFVALQAELRGNQKQEYEKNVDFDAIQSAENPVQKEDSTESTTVALDDSNEERQQWSSPVEFLLSCIAMSVGLGNVWRFPITAYENGGGAFLIPYLVVLIFIGRPLYFLELSLGQFSSSGCIRLWKVVPIAKGIGYGQVMATAAVLTYYVSLMAITLFYLVASFQTNLPWASCDPTWIGNASCVAVSGNEMTSYNLSGANITASNNLTRSSAELFFKNHVMHEASSWSSGLGVPDWKLVICLAVAWLALFLTLVKGVQSAGKVAYFTALFPYLVLFTLLGKGLTLPGAYDGIMYFLTPQWEKLLDPNVWYQAVSQSFFSLSVSFGSISMFSSYNDFKHNVYRDAWIISFMDTGTSVLAGLTIFSILGNLKHELGVEDMDEVVQGGAGLAFITYPTAIAKFHYVPQVFAVLFFLMLFTLGLGSASALTNSIITVICDQKPKWSKAKVTAAACFTGFAIGLVYVTPEGLYILELVDFFGGGTSIFILAILQTCSIAWLYGLRAIVRDIEFMLNVRLGIYWKACWGFVVPAGLAGILAYSLTDFNLPTYNGQPLPTVAYGCGIVILSIAISSVPLGALHAVAAAKGGLAKRVASALQPDAKWGPKKSLHREEWRKAVAESNGDPKPTND